MYKYAKSILTAVSFDNDLFKKEFNKLSEWLSPEEAKNLLHWCIDTFDYELLTKTGLLF
jgi:hypothetical protein